MRNLRDKIATDLDMADAVRGIDRRVGIFCLPLKSSRDAVARDHPPDTLRLSQALAQPIPSFVSTFCSVINFFVGYVCMVWLLLS